jgi:diguanylate cyclase (GGDEF)-like protein
MDADRNAASREAYTVKPSTLQLDLRDGSAAAIAMRALDRLPQAIAVLDEDGRLLVTNDRWGEERAKGDNPLLSASGQDFLAGCAQLPEALAAVGEHVVHGLSRVLQRRADRFEVQYSLPAGDEGPSWFLFTASQLDGVGAVVTVHETTVHHTVQEVLSDLAFHDPLTGLPNRALVLDRLRMAMIRGQRTKSMPAVVFVDLDGFKLINDRFGHDAGDVVLQEVGRRLTRTVREHDTCGRWGGDEFVLVVELTHPEAIESIIERTLAAVADPISLDTGDVHVGMSVGVALGDGSSRVDQLLRLADQAMYDAKRSGEPVRIAVTMP